MSAVGKKMTHPQRVRFLYKMILQTHKALPSELRELGDRYVKEEFRRHKNCDPSYVGPFMMEWSKYLVDITKQIRSNIKNGSVDEPEVEYGFYLDEKDFDHFNDLQLNQLLELAEELHGVTKNETSTSQPNT